MTIGPVQLLVIAFDQPDFEGDVLAELERLREGDVVRVIDVLVVHKDSDGVVQRIQRSDVSTDGAVVSSLIGLDAPRPEADGEHELWSLDDTIPNDSAAPSHSSSIAGRSARATRSAQPEGSPSLTRGYIRPTSLPPA